MPLIKEIMGRVIKDTRRDGDVILVRLMASESSKKPLWMAVSLDFYRANMKCRFVPRGEDETRS